MFGKKNITIFPLGTNGCEVYDIVYLGDVIPNYIGNPMSEVLCDEYVFLFTTMIKQDKESSMSGHTYGHVEIDFIKHDLLSCFNRRIRENGNMHILGNESLKINDFLEIVCEETQQGNRIIAHLKNQNIIKNIREVDRIKNFRILLAQENRSNDIDNIFDIEIAPEFMAKLEFDRAKEHLDYLETGSSVMNRLAYRNLRNTEDVNQIDNVQVILRKEIEHARQQMEQCFENYLRIKNRLPYVHKGTN